MADNADISNDITNIALDRYIQRNSVIPPIPFSGKCLNCEETLNEKRRFCDSICREQFENRARRTR